MNDQEIKTKLIQEVFGASPESLEIQTTCENWDYTTTLTLRIRFRDRFDGELKTLQVRTGVDPSQNIDTEKQAVDHLVENIKHHYDQMVENHFQASGLSKVDFATQYSTVPVSGTTRSYGTYVFNLYGLQLEFPDYTPVSGILRTISDNAGRTSAYNHSYFGFNLSLPDQSPDGSYYDYIESPFVAGFDCGKPLSTQKGIDLLESWLSDEQLTSWREHKTIPCVGCETGVEYLITRKSQVNIKILSGKHEGRTYCIVPTDTVTIEDQMLGQKLIIENNEKVLLEKAVLW